MRKFILGFVSALLFVGIIYLTYPFVSGFIGGPKLVSPENLNPSVKDYGSLRVEIYGKGNPLAGVEVDLGIIGPKGPELMTIVTTDDQGAALFEKVPTGTYDLFFNGFQFPEGYVIPRERYFAEIVKDQQTEKRIDLIPEQ